LSIISVAGELVSNRLWHQLDWQEAH